jgi:hypothetical protein
VQPDSPTYKGHFPATRRLFRFLKSRLARRLYLCVFALLVVLLGLGRLHTYLLTRQIQAALRTLQQVRLDETKEGQIQPLLARWKRVDRTYDGKTWHIYSISISNAENYQLWPFGRVSAAGEGSFFSILSDLGYRHMLFEAFVDVEDGKVSRVSYGLASTLIMPRAAGYTGYIVSATSVHAFWADRRWAGGNSTDDQNPQYRPVSLDEYVPVFGKERQLYVRYTSDAPREVTDHIFRLNLSCFWAVHRCSDAAQIAPTVANDLQDVQNAALFRLQHESPCPDSIVAARMKYLPDVTVTLLEVTSFRNVRVQEEVGTSDDLFTDFKVIESLRGTNPGPWTNIRHRLGIPSPLDRRTEIGNPIQTFAVGEKVLYFGGASFDSCRIIPATPSAIAIVRDAPLPPKRAEDAILSGLM